MGFAGFLNELFNLSFRLFVLLLLFLLFYILYNILDSTTGCLSVLKLRDAYKFYAHF